MSNSSKRMSISLSEKDAELLEYLVQAQGITQNKAIGKAIAAEAYLFKEREAGAKVFLQKPGEDPREIVFR